MPLSDTLYPYAPLCRSSLIRHSDPVTEMVSHRGISHSLLTLTVLAALLAWLFHRWRPSTVYSGAWLFATIWINLVTHPLPDAFTSYGTQLFWPWRPIPANWSSLDRKSTRLNSSH